jgi:hypothetical protein
VTRKRALLLVAGALLVALIAWIGSNTEWAETELPMPLRGEARRNPFYAAQRVAEALGARTAVQHLVANIPADAVVVVSSWHWDLSESRRHTLEVWVEAGGRLVLDPSVVSGSETLERWTGIGSKRRPPQTLEEMLEEPEPEACRTLREPGSARPDIEGFSFCGFGVRSWLTTTRQPTWALEDRNGLQTVRVSVGRGSVTMINGTPFGNRSLLEGDHGRLFVAATALRQGDDLRFLSEDEHPSFLALMWQYGGPVVALALAFVALSLWRGAVRLGPLAAARDRARRSLAEQIRGTGQFALRHGHGEALHTAMLRAIGEAAERRIPGYSRLAGDHRFVALASLTGIDHSELAAALAVGGPRRSRGLRGALAVLEAARRRILIEGRRATHGRD